jgi:hypothetical protein
VVLCDRRGEIGWLGLGPRSQALAAGLREALEDLV